MSHRCMEANTSIGIVNQVRTIHRMLNTNNSAVRLYLVNTGGNPADETGRVALTTEADQCAAIGMAAFATNSNYAQKQVQQSERHNMGNLEAEKVDSILRTLYDDQKFREKYSYSSLFLIGCGSYGCVFRVVSNASGPVENPVYDEQYVRLLQSLRRTKSRKKAALLDSYRDTLCLDLAAMKIEALTPEDVEFRSANKVQLLKEFLMLTELFRNAGSTNAMVGFPLPIEFGFLTGPPASKNFKKVFVFDKYGRQTNYHDAFLGYQTVLNLTALDVTCFSYMTMELVGPNLDEWKTFFAPNHTEMGRVVFSVQTTLKLMDQVLCRLLIMHRNNMVHLDLKPDNICMGVGKMVNTVYLLDYGLSKICSDEKPIVTFGSRRYMSVGVLDMMPANFMMDIESWFYVLIHLLTDFVPWSDDVIQTSGTWGTRIEEKMLIMAKIKRQFWGDRGICDRKLFQRVTEKAEIHHKKLVPDIKEILTDIYSHIWRMRKDFYRVSTLKMHADIRNEESDLFKRYHTLRKLLLFPYNCDFTKGCFSNDKDLTRKQEKRWAEHEMLTFTVNGRNWLWDWDVWFQQEYDRFNCSDKSMEEQNASWMNLDVDDNAANNNPLTGASDDDVLDVVTDYDVNEPYEVVNESIGIPDWMRHYLARVLGGQRATEEEVPSGELTSRSTSTEPKNILVVR